MINGIKENARVGVYLRISKEDSACCSDSQSIKNQKSLILDYIRDKGFFIYDYYVDDGFSGANFDRPAFKRMIKDIEAGKMNVVITKDISRLGRDFIETSHYIFKYFPEKNIRYISILDHFDTMKPNGMEDIIPFQAIINDMYLKDTSKKIKAIRQNKMREGLFVGSCVAYGYKRSSDDNRRIVIDEYSSDVVRRIFNMKLSGLSNVIIARILTNEGISPPNVYSGRNIKLTYTTNLWKATTVGNILKNQIYIGNLVQHKYDRVNYKSKKKRLLSEDEWIVVKNNHEKIISDEIFNCVNNLGVNKEYIRVSKNNYIFKGLVVCSVCGKTMIVRKNYYKRKKNEGISQSFFCCKTYATYRNGVCSMHYFKEQELNNIVFSKIKYFIEHYLDKSAFFDVCYKILKGFQDEDKNLNLSNLIRKKEEISKALDSLYLDKVNKIISEEEFISIKSGLYKKKGDLEEEIRIKEKRRENIKNSKVSYSDLIDDFLSLKNNKMIYRMLVKRIEIDKQVKIFFCFQRGSYV